MRYDRQYYDKISNQMYTLKPLICTSNKCENITYYGIILNGENISVNDIRTKYKDRLIAREFTGGLDKNGKPVYDGDILREDYEDLGEKRTDYCVIEWHNPVYAYVLKHSDTDIITFNDFYGISMSDFVVIGNKYQNPELLEQIDRG